MCNVYTCVILSDTFLCLQVTNTVQVGIITKFIADKSGTTFGRRRAAIDARQLVGGTVFDGDTVAQYFFGTAIVSILPPLFSAIQESAKSVFRLYRKSRLARAKTEGAGRKMKEITENPQGFMSTLIEQGQGVDPHQIGKDIAFYCGRAWLVLFVLDWKILDKIKSIVTVVISVRVRCFCVVGGW